MARLPGKRDSTDLLPLRETVGGRRVPARIHKATDLGVAIEHGRGIVQAARVRGLERVAQEAMSATGALAREEAFWMNTAPHAAGRMQAIADVAAIGMAQIVSDLGRD